jgi:MYXO-CTERM domain-containing protein
VSPTGDPYCDLGPNCSYVKTVAANSGGGCACDVGGSPASPGGVLALLGLAGLGLVWRRRRRSGA